MKRLRNVPIGGKITIALALVIALEVVVALVGLYYLRSLRQALATVVDVDAERIKRAARLNRNLAELETLERNLLLAPTPQAVPAISKAIRERAGAIRYRMEQLRVVADQNDLAALAALAVIIDEYLAELRQIEAKMTQGQQALALKSRKRTEALVDRGSALLKTMVNKLDRGIERAKHNNSRRADVAFVVMLVVMLLSTVTGLGVGILIARMITSDLLNIVSVANRIAVGDLDTPVAVESHDEVGKLALAMQQMQRALREGRSASEDQNWLKSGLTRLNDLMRGEQSIDRIANKAITELAESLDAKVGAVYLLDQASPERQLVLAGSYAYTRRKNLSNRYALGEGLVGQAALEQHPIVISNAPEDYLTIVSGLGEALPRHISVTPFLFEDTVVGVIELGTLGELRPVQLDYLQQAMPIVAITVETARSRERLSRSLAKAQQLAEELQVQQEELKASNEELEAQTQALKRSEDRLKTQQEELEVINEELEQKNELLQQQKRDTERARTEISDKAAELALASKYKSEFLANMSHELRTPLNSLLILARVFADNREGNLSEDQIEAARVIYNSGTELLGLINDILDLAKIEAGRMDLALSRVPVSELIGGISDSFQHIAEEKGLSFSIALNPDAPTELVTDRKRLSQVLKNLVSNAIKFTEVGTVTVSVGPCPAESAVLLGRRPESLLQIAVGDTGIGIPKDKHRLIFEAFQQVDGGTARRFGGTGLGLSITREIVQLLGGLIQLDSEPGEGSTFRVVLPVETKTERSDDSAATSGIAPVATSVRGSAVQRLPASGTARPVVADDRDRLHDDDTAILIVDDDPVFADFVAQTCREKGFKTLVATTGEEGLKLAETHSPRAVILDIRLPGMDGWSVLEMLKDNPRTRHLPIHMMSVDDADVAARRRGAIGFLRKPAQADELDAAFQRITETFSKSIKAVLVIEDDPALRQGIIGLIADRDVTVDEAESGGAALTALAAKTYDCIVLDLGLPDMDGIELLRELESRPGPVPPVIIYTGRALTYDEELDLRNFSESIIIKDVRSEERLMDEVSLFLHSVVSQMSERKRKVITDLHNVDRLFKDKQILLVDDDMRTVFALSRILSVKGVVTHKAENGQRALALLEQHPEIDLVLMDIMMPVMDGYETMRRIRAQDRFRQLPIIALTAKAMKGDQEQCIAAGANDYLAKPIEEARLFSMMRVWLYR